MTQPFDIQTYMTQGVGRVVGDIMKATFAQVEALCKRG